MKISRQDWILYIALALAGIIFWWLLSYRQLIFPDLKINRRQAETIALDYLRKIKKPLEGYKTATIFMMDESANRYLQKTIGRQGLEEFIKTYDFQFFFWVVRIFKPESKEEFRLGINPDNGEILSYRYHLEDTAKRPKIEKNTAQSIAWNFLHERFQHAPEDFHLQGENQTLQEFRTDHSFTWQHKKISIPWKGDHQNGTGRFLTSVTLSGNEIISFNKNYFKVPDDFSRYVEREKTIGENISVFIKITYYIFLIGAIYVLLTRQTHLAMIKTKKFYIALAYISILISILNEVNAIEIINFNYRTTAPLTSYYWQTAITAILNIIIMSLIILIPGLAGEWLHFQTPANHQDGSLLNHIIKNFKNSFLTQKIFMGYLGAAILLGLQSIFFYFGKSLWSVWMDHQWLTQFSSAYIPFLVALVIGWKASLYEELMYRLFAINWIQSILQKFTSHQNLIKIIAVTLSAIIWGFAHSQYPVFPMWFRGVEVSLLGLFLGWLYLQFGLITVLISHYTFDVFWASLEFLFSPSINLHQLSAWFVLGIPALIGLGLKIRNTMKCQTTENETALNWHLNEHQKFNLELLTTYFIQHASEFHHEPDDSLREKVIRHGWDRAVVEMAIENFRSFTHHT